MLFLYKKIRIYRKIMEIQIKPFQKIIHFKPILTIKTKNLNFKLDNLLINDSSIKKNLKKSSLNLNQLICIDLRPETYIKKEFEDFYEIQQKIGQGGHSVVYKCKDLIDGKSYAVKVTRKKDPEIFENLKSQFRILNSINHQGILRGFYIFLNEKKSTCHLVSQYYNFPNLRQFFLSQQNLPIKQEKARQIIKLILQPLIYLHERKISHRDLKPQNILYDQRKHKIKIIDFQVAKMPRYTHQKLQMWTKTGTPSYQSPELLKGSYNQLTDMWSLGIIVFEMLSGKFPFEKCYERDLYDEIVNFVPNFNNILISQTAKNFISKLLKRDPKERMNAKQALSHPFILLLLGVHQSNLYIKDKNVCSDDYISFKMQEEKIPQSKFYDQNTKFTFLENIGEDIGIRFCQA